MICLPTWLRGLGALLLMLSGAAWAGPPLAWQAQIGDHKPDWIVGSFHLLPPEAATLPAAYQRALAAAEVLVLESDLETLANPMQLQGLMGQAMAPEGGLKGLVGDRLYRQFERTAVDLGLPVESMAMFRPWFVAMSLEVLNYTRAGFRPDLGVDQRLLVAARERGLPLRWLEEPEAHMQLLSGMPAALERDFFAAAVQEGKQAEPDQLLKIWQSGDVGALARLSADMRRRYPALHKRLLLDRNRQWLQPILQMLRDDQSQLIVVGAAHLAGDGGVLKLVDSYARLQRER